MNVASPCRALIVDDEPTIRQAVMRALNQGGFTCDGAADGRAAIELVKQSCFDVVITDLRMPEVNGHTLVVDLLELPSRPAVVVLTGVVEPKLTDDLWARGVDDIQYKPVDFSLLTKKIRRIVEQRQRAASSSRDTTANAPAAGGSIDASPASNERGISSAAATAPDRKTIGHVAERTTKTASTLNAHDLAKAFEKLQNSITTKQQQTSIRYVLLFAGGLLLGWLLSWFGPVATLWR